MQDIKHAELIERFLKPDFNMLSHEDFFWLVARDDIFERKELYDQGVLYEFLSRCNIVYRAGTPIIPDMEYDILFERLRRINPNHPFLYVVGPDLIGLV